MTLDHEVENAVYKRLCDLTGLEIGHKNRKSSISCLGIDSIEFYGLVGDLEEDFNFRGKIDDVELIGTIGDLIDYVKERALK